MPLEPTPVHRVLAGYAGSCEALCTCPICFALVYDRAWIAHREWHNPPDPNAVARFEALAEADLPVKENDKPPSVATEHLERLRNEWSM